MDFFNDSIELISDYISQASQEYSIFERTRHKHFTHEGLEGSHKKAIKYWLEILDKGVHSFNEEIRAVGEGIINRSTEDIQDFYKNIDDEENRQFFIQLLMKHEKKLLNLDKDRYKKYKNASVEADDFKPIPKKQEKPVKEIIKKAEPANKNLPDEETIKSIRAKELITVEEFTILFNVSKRTQATWRTRSKDKNPVPYVQITRNGTIKYKLNEVDIWFENERR